jgi:hypothetical protein
MAKAFMANPELRHPYPETPIHPQGSTTILYQGNTITLDNTGPGDGLLVQLDDLARINGFTVKPEGACFDSMCIPLRGNLLVEVDGQTWLDLEAFAEHMGQAFVADRTARVWSFAEMPAKRENLLTNGMAPDLNITDRQGNVFNLTDLKGKKALIVTWSSW